MIFWNLNIGNFVKDYLGRKFFRPRQYDWLMSLLSPLETTINNYTHWRKERFYLINITGQVISLTGYLNDKFDANQRRIYIVTSNVIYNGLWVALEEEINMFLTIGLEYENQGLWVGMELEQSSGYDFIVYIPTDIISSDTINLLESTIYHFKLAGKTFYLETF